mmetsp:Transcript_10365/g.22439  ORF Transcript_10365/g.22439 Transcript_10365/m.22439 type:complete len:87 (-) Transcript_10365:85-345(-)
MPRPEIASVDPATRASWEGAGVGDCCGGRGNWLGARRVGECATSECAIHSHYFRRDPSNVAADHDCDDDNEEGSGVGIRIVPPTLA